MMTLVDPLFGAHVEEIIEIVVYAAAENQFDTVVESCVIRRHDNYAPAWNEDAVNFTQDSLRRKRMVLNHVGVRHEVKLVVRKRQRLSPNVTLLVVDAVVGNHLLKNFCGRPIVYGRRVAPEFHGVYGQRTELRPHIQHAGWSRARGSMTQDITQDSILSPARPDAPPNPIGKIGRHSRIARDQLENLFETVQCWELFLHSGKTEVYTSEHKTCGVV